MNGPEGRISIHAELVGNYFSNLINMFYKILPMRENGEETLPVYLESLAFELAGAKSLIEAVRYDAQFLSLLAILQNLIDNPDTDVAVVKREVFRAISVCNKLKTRHGFRKLEQ